MPQINADNLLEPLQITLCNTTTFEAVSYQLRKSCEDKLNIDTRAETFSFRHRKANFTKYSGDSLMILRLSATTTVITFIFIFTSCYLHATFPITSSSTSIELRQNALLSYLAKQPDQDENIWRLESYATASYSQNVNLNEANQAVIKISSMLNEKTFKNKHWHIYLLARLYWLNTSADSMKMSSAAEKSVIECFSNFLSNSEIELSSMGNDEYIWTYISSENHHIQTYVSVWSAANILANIENHKTDKFSGLLPSEIKRQIEKYFKKFIVEKSTKGLLTEVASPTYSKYSINALINLYDFTTDLQLKKLVDMFFTVYFADWGIEQFEGIRGGSKHRAYTGAPSIRFESSVGWIPFGLGKQAIHPAYLSFATTKWRPKPFLLEILNEKQQSYEIYSRRPGLKNINNENKRAQSPDGGGLLRYSYVTTNFIAGMSMVNATDDSSWTNYSSQNRRNFIVYRGKEPAKIFTQRINRVNNKSDYNAEWGVQDKGVMILQLLPKPYSRNAADEVVFISNTLSMTFESHWYFFEAPEAYSALRLVSGKGTIRNPLPSDYRNGDGDLSAGKYLQLSNNLSPIIIETNDKQSYSNFEEFKKEILTNDLQYTEEKLTYTSQAYKNKLTLYTDYSRLPEINDTPVNLSPGYAFKSEYISAQYASGIVLLHIDDKQIELDFNEISVDIRGR